MHEEAVLLKKDILANYPNIYEMFSELGKEIYYPKGILSQSAEAKKRAFSINATIGVATVGKQPMYLESMNSQLDYFNADEVVSYAPPAGINELRQLWKDKLLKDNPSLRHNTISLPIVTNGITNGLSILSDLFCDTNDRIIVPNKIWGNYKTIFELKKEANFSFFELFDNQNNFNYISLDESLNETLEKKVILILNFPNNPTGYTPTDPEADEIKKILLKHASLGKKIITIIDDAYFGLFYENSIQESIFTKLLNLHPNLLPIKLDGATKEQFAWGLRVGFITYPNYGETVNNVLEKKTLGIIRSSISSGPQLSQSVVVNSLKQPELAQEIKNKNEILKKRALKVKRILNEAKYKEHLRYYPFNSGYFMCLKLEQVNAEELRVYLLNEYGIGTISINDTDLRIAFSSVDEDKIDYLFEKILEATLHLSNDRIIKREEVN